MVSASEHRFAGRLIATCLLLAALTSSARIGVEYQMPLGNPSGATTDTNNHSHYLIQRSVFAMDYNDQNGVPNWVSWNLTAEDIGETKRSSFREDTDLPASFYRVKEADYKGTGFDRGHMCPSADRTDKPEHNRMVFVMSNIIPQEPDNNQGVWKSLEDECRALAKSGNELLILCGPGGGSGERLVEGKPMIIPSHTWKVVVVVPQGPGSVLSRITAATRVIAVWIPNRAGVRNDAWSKYEVSVSRLESLTGYRFFTGLAPELAAALKGVSTTGFAGAASHPSNSTNWPVIAVCVMVVILVGCIVVLVVFFRMRPKK